MQSATGIAQSILDFLERLKCRSADFLNDGSSREMIEYKK